MNSHRIEILQRGRGSPPRLPIEIKENFFEQSPTIRQNWEWPKTQVKQGVVSAGRNGKFSMNGKAIHGCISCKMPYWTWGHKDISVNGEVITL
jgi:hypothetical protein